MDMIRNDEQEKIKRRASEFCSAILAVVCNHYLSSNLVAEADEANNETTSQLTCNPSLPDLAVTGITFTKDCRTQVHLENVGRSPCRTTFFFPGGHF